MSDNNHRAGDSVGKVALLAEQAWLASEQLFNEVVSCSAGYYKRVARLRGVAALRSDENRCGRKWKGRRFNAVQV